MDIPIFIQTAIAAIGGIGGLLIIAGFIVMRIKHESYSD